jgi:hypothetical protein
MNIAGKMRENRVNISVGGQIRNIHSMFMQVQPGIQ